jgi:hypothetical protein
LRLLLRFSWAHSDYFLPLPSYNPSTIGMTGRAAAVSTAAAMNDCAGEARFSGAHSIASIIAAGRLADVERVAAEVVAV